MMDCDIFEWKFFYFRVLYYMVLFCCIVYSDYLGSCICNKYFYCWNKNKDIFIEVFY